VLFVLPFALRWGLDGKEGGARSKRIGSQVRGSGTQQGLGHSFDGKRDGWIIVVDGGSWRRRRWWWCMMMGANILIHVLLLLPYCIALPIHPRLELELDGTADDGWGCG